MKLRFEVNRVFDVSETRYRTLYVAERELTPLDRFIQRNSDGGRELVLRLSGTF